MLLGQLQRIGQAKVQPRNILTHMSAPNTPEPSTNSPKAAKLPNPTLLSAFWFGTAFLWLLLLTIFMPAHVQSFVGNEHKEPFLGMLVAIGSVMALIIPPVVGAHSDRTGRRLPYLRWGVGINIAGLLIMAAAVLWWSGMTGFWVYLAGFLLVQFGNNYATAPYSALIPQLIPSHQRGKYSGSMATLQAAGQLSGVVVGIILGQLKLTQLVPFIVISLVLAVTALLTLLTVSEHNPNTLKQHNISETPAKQSWAQILTEEKNSFLALFSYQAFKWVFITRLLFALGQYSIQPYLQYYTKDVLKQDDPVTSSAFMMLGIIVCSGISAFIGGPLSDRIGRKAVIYVAGGLMTAMALLFLVAPSFGVALVFACMFGLGFGAFASVDWALGADAMPSSNNYARDMGIWHVAFVAPQMISGLQGWLLNWGNQNSDSGTFGYTLIFGIAAIFFSLGIILVKNVPDNNKLQSNLSSKSKTQSL